MKILAIETSCDETSIAILETSGRRRQPTIRVRAHFVSSQIKLHAAFGGVVPNLAKREHQRLLAPMLVKALKNTGMFQKSGIKNMPRTGIHGQNFLQATSYKLQAIFEREPDLLTQFEKKIIPLSIPDIDAIAVTHGPGLAPALWVGVNFAHALAVVWKKPVIPVNHMKGHLFSALLQCGKKNDQYQVSNIKFSLLALLVSGGHTELVLMKKMGSYKIIGETLDDAAGEAFDKVARMMKLGYPGGPAVAAEAAKAEAAKFKDLKFKNLKIKLPRPMVNSKDYNFSFSGLKTAVLYTLRDMPKNVSVSSVVPAMAKEFQDAVIDVLVAKTMRAAKEYDAKTIAIGGGVSANRLLRERLSQEVQKYLSHTQLHFPHASLTGDNALMIAVAAFFDGKKKAPNQIRAEANIRLDS